MALLADEQVIAGKKDLSASNKEETDSLLALLPDWTIIQDDGMDKLIREYRFSDYQVILALSQKIGRMAIQVNHHPLIEMQWGKVTVSWWTHTLGGLHRNDFIMAARCDRVAMLVSAP